MPAIPVPHPRRKLESLKADYAARNPGATKLQDRHIAAIMGVSPPRVAALFDEDDYDKTGKASPTPSDRLGRLVAWLQGPTPLQAFPDHIFGIQGIRIEIDWMSLPWADFEARRAAAGSPLVLGHPRNIFGSQISAPSFMMLKAEQLLGALTPAEEPRKPVFRFDSVKPPRYVETIRLRVEIPFDGWLTVVGADADHGSWKFWCFDPFLNIENRPMERGWTLPYQKAEAIPLYGPAGDCLIIGIATRGKGSPWLRLPWKDRSLRGAGVREVDVEDLRDISGQLKRRNLADYLIGLIEYEMVPDAMGRERH